MDSNNNYKNAVTTIKEAILQSQYDSLKSVNEKHLILNFAIGKYISNNTRNGTWGQDAIGVISERLQKEMPGLRGFSETNMKYMRIFYEEWCSIFKQPIVLTGKDKINSSAATDEITIKDCNFKNKEFSSFSLSAFLSISFTNHVIIISKTKELAERIYYINKTASEHLTAKALTKLIEEKDYKLHGHLINNFFETIPNTKRAFKAIESFKSEYLLDYLNTEELDVRDKEDVDERVLENNIVHNIKNYILTFGEGFAFVRNQFRLEAFGEDQYIDLLFFNRDLNCLVAIELKKGKFKTSYLGQLSGYLSILDKEEKREHENPSIGIVLCKDYNKSFVDYVIHDFNKPMGVSTYNFTTSKDMSDELRKVLPDIEELRKLLDESDDIDKPVKKSKRVGSAKEEMKDFKCGLDDFNSIRIEKFD